MAGDTHGDKAQEEPEAQEGLGQQQAVQDQPQVSSADWEKAVAERDEKIAALEARVAEAAKNAETAEQLRGEIAELKAQGEKVCAMPHTRSTSSCIVDADLPRPPAIDRQESPLSSPCSMAFRSLLSSLQYAFLLFFFANSRSFPSGGPDARRSGKDALSCKTHPNACG